MTGREEPAFEGLMVPKGFYERPALRAALAQRDWSAVFLALRAELGLSQQGLADATGMDQSWVSKIERKVKTLENLDPVIRVANALCIPAPLLGFGAAPGTSTNWLNDRNFFELATAAALGIGVPEMAHLRQLRPRHDDLYTPRRIDTPDVTALRATTTIYRRWDNRQGGGIKRADARAHVRFARLLKNATCTNQVRADLHLATAEAAMVAAWMSYDMGGHHDARVHWLLALDEARHADVESSADLMVDVLLDMAHQSLHLRDPHEAFKLTELATAVVAGHRYPVSVSTRSYLDINRAWCRAAQGEIDSTHRALDMAHQRYADADPTTAAPWATHVGPAEIAAQHGHALFLLSEAVAGTNRAAAETAAAKAIGHLRSAIDGYGGDYARSAAVNLPGLASCLLRVGDIPAAVTAGHQAVTAITALSSRRPLARLHRLADTALQLSHHQDVADLRRRIIEATAA
ncbi:transcriptional regulator with XRE-family HTH domain [Lentzea atacamensis]|uniref:Transcriptional regulator with XRE-family HTH domain n=1 Tax=Lentzea atacamensis TaxID=531938 RepID=A0ABX9DW59_9PSEU|nr:helix-turn-helix transcriptional regulator [Lentzea atacamensis]RAS59528.1 transcriptional regulator with XRE-family HTH domain [Lentzea atacamensis]